MRSAMKEQTRMKIIQTALELFIRKGYGATRMSDIAKEANISVGNIFNYFKSKEELYETLINLGLERMTIDFSQDIVDPLDFFSELIHDIFNQLEKNRDAAKMFVLMDQALYLDIISDELKQALVQGQKLIDYGAALLEEGQRTKKIRPGNPVALSIAFFSAIQGIAQHLAVDPTAPIPEPEWLLSLIRTQ